MTKPDKNHVALMQAIATLQTGQAVIETKVDELVRRVGIQNGRVADTEGAIKKILERDEREDGARKGFSSAWKIVVVILTLVIGVLTIIATWHHSN